MRTFEGIFFLFVWFGLGIALGTWLEGCRYDNEARPVEAPTEPPRYMELGDKTTLFCVNGFEYMMINGFEKEGKIRSANWSVAIPVFERDPINGVDIVRKVS